MCVYRSILELFALFASLCLIDVTDHRHTRVEHAGPRKDANTMPTYEASQRLPNASGQEPTLPAHPHDAFHLLPKIYNAGRREQDLEMSLRAASLASPRLRLRISQGYTCT